MNLKLENKVITYTLGLYLFLLPWDGYFSLETSLPFSPSYFFLGFLLIIYILHACKNKFYILIIPKYIIPLFFLISYATITLTWTQNLSDAYNTDLLLWSFLFTAILIIAVVYHMKIKIKLVLWFYVLGTLSVGVFSLITNDYPLDRLTIAEDYNPTWYAAFIVWAVVVTVKLYQDSKISTRFLLIVIDLILIIFLLLTQGRNSILAITVSLVIISILQLISMKQKNNIYLFSLKKLKPLKLIKSFLIISIIISVLIIFIYTTGINEQLNRVGEITELFGGDSSKATAGRTTIWKNYLSSIDESNIFGVGVESSKNVYKNEYGIDNVKHTPHNSYILILIEYGVIGLLLWLIFIWSFIKYSFNNNNSRYILLWISFITVFLALGNDILTYKYWWIGLFMFILISKSE